jgi:hypothetical protein
VLPFLDFPGPGSEYVGISLLIEDVARCIPDRRSGLNPTEVTVDAVLFRPGGEYPRLSIGVVVTEGYPLCPFEVKVISY